VAGDVTFHNPDRDVTMVGTWHDKDRGMKALQGKDEDREARKQKQQKKTRLSCKMYKTLGEEE
jgi:hypothetical protein